MDLKTNVSDREEMDVEGTAYNKKFMPVCGRCVSIKLSFLDFVQPRGTGRASKTAAVINSNVGNNKAGQICVQKKTDDTPLLTKTFSTWTAYRLRRQLGFRKN